MTTAVATHVSTSSSALAEEPRRLDYLDATRAFALVLGIVFHASLSFMPMFFGWAVQDVSTSSFIPKFIAVSHSFRMETFFLVAGFFGHRTYHRKGAADFIRSRALRIAVPFVVGWFFLHPLLVSGWSVGTASMRGSYRFSTGISEGFHSLSQLPMGLFQKTHLWFLYYLALITAVTLGLRAMVTMLPFGRDAVQRLADQIMNWVVRSRLGSVACVAGTIGLLWFMRIWGVDTPDQSLIPEIPVVLLYGGFFLLGWLFGRQPHLIGEFAQLSWNCAITAGLGVAATVYFTRFQLDPGHPRFAAAHVGFVVSYAVMMWSLVRLVIGALKHLCDQPRAWIRYAADSSYWLYLVHLPVVVWLQVAVANWPVHWTLKLTGICAVTVGVCLLSYDLFVRSTLIGFVLNGRRSEGVLVHLFRGHKRRRKDAKLPPKQICWRARLVRAVGTLQPGQTGPSR